MNKAMDLADLHAPDVTTEDREEFARLSSTLLDIPFCPWQPNWLCNECRHDAHGKKPCVGTASASCYCDGGVAVPSPQVLFLLDFGREAMYGGAVAGGKSIALLMAASQFLNVPGYAALVLRKSYADLLRPRALMDIAAQWWGGRPDVKFNAQNHTYTFACPGGGQSIVTFGSLDNENDRYKFQGGAYAYCGFDETTQFKEVDYRYLFSRLRRPQGSKDALARVPIRMRSASNPGGVGAEWVNRRFIVPWLAWKKGDASRPTRNFYPALIADNPKLDEEDYVESLSELDPVTRAQLMKGDWQIRPDGRMLSRSWFKPIAYDDVPGNLMWVRAWDMASTADKPDAEPDFTAGGLVGRSANGQYYIMDIRRWRKEAADNDVLVRWVSEEDTKQVVIVMEQEPGAQAKIALHHYRSFVLPGFNFRGVPTGGKRKILRAGPMASQAQAGNVFMVEGPWNEDWLEEVEIFPDGLHDDQVDAVSLAFSVLAKSARGQIRLGAQNEGLSQPNYWKPIKTPDVTAWGPEGGRIAMEREAVEVEQDQREIQARVANAWGM